MKVLVTGATGFIGKELGKKLVERGHKVFIVARDATKAKAQVSFPCEVIEGDLSKGSLTDKRVAQMEGVVHLLGENISSGRWTSSRKKRILDSRTEGTRHLLNSLNGSVSLTSIVSASAIGYYGDRKDELLTEESAKGQGFLSDVCKEWEAPFSESWNQNRFPRAHWAIFRFGVVLSAFGGALEKMMLPFRYGVGGKLGDGKQWMSWIHIDDLVELLVAGLENKSYQGIFNAVATEPATNEVFTEKLASALDKKVGPSVPAPALKLALGEMSTVVLNSQKVSNAKVLKQGFHFKFADLRSALSNCCAPHKNGDMVLRAEQYIQKPRAEIFPFFADANNLEKITPPSLGFHIVNVSTKQMGKGTLIDYKLKVHGVPMKWKTSIEEWKPDDMFVDNQISGPYKKWHHTHEFKDLGEGTLMTDTVIYRLPMGKLGEIVGGWLVKTDVNNIFDYRKKFIAKNF